MMISSFQKSRLAELYLPRTSTEPFAHPKLIGHLFKCQNSKKYPFRKRKGLLFLGCETFGWCFGSSFRAVWSRTRISPKIIVRCPWTMRYHQIIGYEDNVYIQQCEPFIFYLYFKAVCTHMVKLQDSSPVLHNLNKIYRLLTKREVKMAGYWPSSFLRVYGPRRSRGP